MREIARRGPGGQQRDDFLLRQRRFAGEERLRLGGRAVEIDVDVVIPDARRAVDVERGIQRRAPVKIERAVIHCETAERERCDKVFDAGHSLQPRCKAGAAEVQIGFEGAVGQIPLHGKRFDGSDGDIVGPVAQWRGADGKIEPAVGGFGHGPPGQADGQNFDFAKEPALGHSDLAAQEGLGEGARKPQVRVGAQREGVIADNEGALGLEPQVEHRVGQRIEPQAACH